MNHIHRQAALSLLRSACRSAQSAASEALKEKTQLEVSLRYVLSACAFPTTPTTPTSSLSPVTPSTSAAGHEHCVDFAAFCVQVIAFGHSRSTAEEGACAVHFAAANGLQPRDGLGLLKKGPNDTQSRSLPQQLLDPPLFPPLKLASKACIISISISITPSITPSTPDGTQLHMHAQPAGRKYIFPPCMRARGARRAPARLPPCCRGQRSNLGGFYGTAAVWHRTTLRTAQRRCF
eukprot:COSAG03_NODE_2989_length_2304_cov_15.298731_2_plen_235_part_00